MWYGMPDCFSWHSDAQWFIEPQLQQPPRVQERPWRDLSYGREDLPLSSRRLLSWERRLADSFPLRGYDFLLSEFRERTEKREESEDDLCPRKDERDELRSLVSRLSPPPFSSLSSRRGSRLSSRRPLPLESRSRSRCSLRYSLRGRRSDCIACKPSLGG